MATVTAPLRTHRAERLLVAAVVAAAVVGVVVAAVPSVALLVDPPDPGFCPAILPPVTSCVPEAHLVVVAVAVVVLAVAWVAADVVVRRMSTERARGVVVAGVAVVAYFAWSAARVPQPYFTAWSALVG